MVNPNSFNNLRLILDFLKPLLLGNRQWVFIGADGPPYTLLRRIIEEEPLKYSWVVLVSGRGHLGMNQLKTFFKVVDKVFGEILGKDVLNFNTPKAYSYFIDCKDTHKSWQSLEIFLHGTTMEMVHMYKATLGDGDLPTAMGFLDWQAETASESETFDFISQITLSVALAIYIQRVGDRNNDEEVSEAGRLKFMNMFYGFNHPIYREIEYNELRQKVCCPSPISELRKQNLTFSSSSSCPKANHEGGDFKLENQIKKIKALAPKGKKDEEMWRRTIRGTPAVAKVVEYGKQLLKMQDEQASRKVRIEPEVVKWRAHLRYSNYLSVESDHVLSMSGARLSDSLTDFSHSLKCSRLHFWKMVQEGTPLQSIRYPNVRVQADSDDEDGDDVIECYDDTSSDDEDLDYD